MTAVPDGNAQPAPLFASVPGAASSATTALGFLNQCNVPPATPQVNSAFEMLGRPPTSPSKTVEFNKEETMMKALVAALSGDRKLLPGWNGNVETLRGWLRQLSLWELDNNLPKNRWGLKLLQSFSEGSAPRKIAETIDVSTLTSDAGYGAILSAILAKYAPFLEAAGPASIEAFFYGGERSKQESFSTYVAAKEVALQELEANLGERLPTKVAGRILLRHAGLSDTQHEAMAVKYNSMMTFEQAASALRPLDRPEALVTKVAKTYMAATNYEDLSEQPEGDEDEEYDDEELQPDDDGSGPESDGNGNLTYLLYDTNEEFTEEETAYIFAYNSAYRDVRRELQAKRKGRQFFKPRGSGVIKKGKNKGHEGQSKGKGHSSSFRSGQGRGRGNRGTPEELMAKTRCFSCGQLGHMSRECPQRGEGQSSNFFVCQGSSGVQNRVYVNISESKEKQLSVFAGVQTQGHEAVVDTAAEEAVIGSTAMLRLREQLAQHGLQPVQASGATVTCAGIGGSAKIVGVFDIPVGVASTNGLLRVTEITDEGSFKTPFLLPISYIELVGATIDTNREQFILRNGKSTPMKRVPSGHRTISIMDFFNNKWMVPDQLRAELNFKDVNPFLIPKKQTRKNVTFQQRPGVAVWMKTEDRLHFMGILKGRRNTLVDPKEIFSAAVLTTLKPSRVTVASFCDNPAAMPFSIHDSWQHIQHRQLPFWSGDVFFETFASVGPIAHHHAAQVPAPAHVCGDVHNALSCEAATMAANASSGHAVQDPGQSKCGDVPCGCQQHVKDVKHVHFSDATDDVSNMPCHEVQSVGVQPADISSSKRSQEFQLADLRVPQVADASLQDRVAAWLVADDQEMAESPIRAHRSALQKIYAAWRRMIIMVFRTYLEILQQSAADYLVSRNQGTVVSMPKHDLPVDKKSTKPEGRVRRGIGQPLPRSTASKEWQYEPSSCAHAEEMLRQRGSKQMFWWTCLGCGSRWQRLEWEMDQVENAKTCASSSTDRAKVKEQKVTASSSATYPARLPPPKSRPDLKALVIQDAGVPQNLMPPSPTEEPDKSPKDDIDKSPMSIPLMTQGPIMPK